MIFCLEHLELPSTLMAKVIDTVTPTTTPKRISWPDTHEGNTAVYTVLATRTEIDGITIKPSLPSTSPSLRQVKLLGIDIDLSSDPARHSQQRTRQLWHY